MHWTTASSHVRQQVTTFVDSLYNFLGAQLLGVYLHGSLAMGCFNPLCSDLDLLVVAKEKMTPSAKCVLAQLLLNVSHQPYPIEISFLCQADLHPWRHPTPYDFHYGEDWRSKIAEELETDGWQTWQHHPEGDPDLAGHVMITRQRGVCLIGEPITDLFPIVPAADYTASIRNDILGSLPQIEANPVYTVLNVCRTLAWLRQQQVFSKAEGGEWGLTQLPVEWQGVIRHALSTYRSDSSEPVPIDALRVELQTFAAEVRMILDQ